jgi:hypothetical protein
LKGSSTNATRQSGSCAPATFLACASTPPSARARATLKWLLRASNIPGASEPDACAARSARRTAPDARTCAAPQLGWLLTRELYKRELEPRWPSEHWDHWMRSETVHKTSRGRECLIPQVPRTFHHGAVRSALARGPLPLTLCRSLAPPCRRSRVALSQAPMAACVQSGTFMNPTLHAKLFASIAVLRDDQIRWPPAERHALTDALTAAGYETRLRARLAASHPLTELAELFNAGAGAGTNATDLTLWYDMAPRDASNKLFSEIASFFGIWHEMRRAQHNGVHELWCHGRPVLIANLRVGPDAKRSPYADLMPRRSDVFQTVESFKRARQRARTVGPDGSWHEGAPQTSCRTETRTETETRAAQD